MAQKQRRVSLSLTDPKKDGKKWAVRAIVTVTEGKDPAEGHEVETFLEGESVGRMPTGSDGRVIFDLSVANQPGKHLIEVRCPGSRPEVRHIIIPESQKKKEEAKVLITPTRVGSKHTLYCRLLTVTGDSDKPRVGTLIFFDQEKELGRAETSLSGETVFTIQLERWRKKQIIRIVVQGTSTTQVVHLYQDNSWNEAHHSTF